MKTIILFLCSLFVIQTSCLSPSRFDWRDIQDYQEIINLYPKFLVSHLPERITIGDKGIMALQFPRGKYLNFIHLGIICSDAELVKLREEAVANAKCIYHIGDSCLRVPYDYQNFRIIESDSIRNLHSNDTLPVSNFSTWNLGLPSDLGKGTAIYLLNAKKGRFLADSCLTRGGVGLPDEWIHGYTKGITIYKNYVLYWLEVW